MKRYLVTSVRTSTDKQSGDPLLFISLYKLPSRMKEGGLWFPKNDEALATACINGKNSKDEYDKLKVLLPGALVDVALGVNDFNNKTYVAKIDLVKQSPYKQDEIYL